MPYSPTCPTALHALQPYTPTPLQPSVANGYNKYATLTGLRTELLPAEVENNH